MGRLVQQAGILPLLVSLPGLELVEQGIEVFPERVQFGDVGRRYSLLESTLAADVIGNLGQGLEGCRDGSLHPARHIECPQDAEQQAHQGRHQGLQEKAQQVLSVTDQVDPGYLLVLPHHGELHRPRQDQAGQLLFQAGPGGRDVPPPARQHLTVGQQNTGAGDVLPGGDGLQGILGRILVIEHHGRLRGVADGTRHQLEVVIRIEAQGQQRRDGQEEARHADGGQGDHHVGTPQALSQRESRVCVIDCHRTSSSALASFSTAGCTRTPLRASASRLTRKRTRSPACRQNTASAMHSRLCSLMLRMA
ncbi:hypothetical protein D3C85_853390 [compost metagenome]